MFYQINNKYYVKMNNYYKEVIVKNGDVVPSTSEDSRLYDMNVIATPISYEDVLKKNIRNNRRIEK